MARLGRVVLAPYKMASGTAHDLAGELGAKRLKNPTKFRPSAHDLIINWGCSEESWPLMRSFGPLDNFVLNRVSCVTKATNKVEALRAFTEAGVPCPDWTIDRHVAERWKADGHTVVCRTLLRASMGRGIVLCNGADQLPAAPLYTKYVKKKREFRVHILARPGPGDDAFDVLHLQQKKRRSGVEVNNQIRSWDNGWVFCVRNVAPPECVASAAKAAVAALGLHFGAVDVGYNERAGTACVYEVNTAPSLIGATLDVYAAAFRERYGL